MLSKIIKVVFVVAIVAYFSFWYLAIDWIDNADEMQVLVISTEHEQGNKQLISFVKGIWKIVPAIDFDKDAERFLKLISFSVLQEDNESFEEFSIKLRNNYQLISDYYDKNKNQLSDEMKNKFALKKLILINRSFKSIKDSGFEASITHLEEEITKFPLEEQVAWYNELVFYYGLFDISKYDDTYSTHRIEYANIHNDNLIKTVGKLNKENKTKDFSVLFLLHTGIKGCLYSYMYQNTFSNDTLSEMMSTSEDYMKKLNSKLGKSSLARKIINKHLSNNLNMITIAQTINGGDQVCKQELNKMLLFIN